MDAPAIRPQVSVDGVEYPSRRAYTRVNDVCVFPYNYSWGNTNLMTHPPLWSSKMYKVHSGKGDKNSLHKPMSALLRLYHYDVMTAGL
jgi:hypothetical protein